MAKYLLYLTNKTIVEASVNERQNDEMYLGDVEVDLEDLEDLLYLMQNTADCVILQMAQKAGVMGSYSSKKSDSGLN